MPNQHRQQHQHRQKNPHKGKAAKKTIPTTFHSSLSRKIIWRILRIHHAIVTRRRTNMVSLARELECGRKTIQRDIDFMRDVLQLPLFFNDTAHAWYYGSPVAHPFENFSKKVQGRY